MKKYKRKSKAERQAWWRNLSDEEKQDYLDRAQQRKTKKRQQIKMTEAKRLGLNYSCSECFHGITESCTDRPQGGCSSYYNAITGEEGPALAKQKRKKTA